jgi:uncharacterized protein YjbI with pentapeptide repeats
MGASLKNADLRNADMEYAAICSEDTTVVSGSAVYRQPSCAQLDGAQLRGANLRHAQRCVWENDSKRCTPVTRDMLERLGHANLDGALTP